MLVKIFTFHKKFFFSCFIIAFSLLGIFLFSNNAISAEKVNINTSSQEELETLSGIGPSKAAAIIVYRQEKGPFNNIEEIMNVSGIGQVTFDKIKDYITVSEGNGGEKDDLKEKEEIKYSDKIMLNELLPNPSGSDEAEWIELKNLGGEAVDLVNWKISDLSGKTYVIKSVDFTTTIINANGFFLLPASITNIALNNSNGETVKLFDPVDNLINEVSYAETVNDDIAWARANDGSWHWTTTLTPASENVITAPAPPDGGGGTGYGLEETKKEEKKQESKYSLFKDKILITEFLPNPLGIDAPETEWLEIYNTSTENVNLVGWQLKDNQSEFVFPATTLAAKSFLILNGSQTKLILNNVAGDFLELSDENNKQVFKLSYTRNAPEGESYNFCASKWLWLAKTTAGQENACPPKNEPPLAYFEISQSEFFNEQEVTLDARESYDVDGKVIKYIWEFEKEVGTSRDLSDPGRDLSVMQTGKTFETAQPVIKVKFLKLGPQKINLKVIDNLAAEDDYNEKVEVKFNQGSLPDLSQLKITEFLPNPVGADEEGEWIEIFNSSVSEINLSLFQLDDGEGGSSPYTFGQVVMPANSYLVVKRTESHLALNNDADKVRLLAPTGELLQEVNYEEVEEGMSYARDEQGKWFWTEKVTPGEKNTENTESTESTLRLLSGQAKTQKQSLAMFGLVKIGLEDVRELELGSQVQVQGVVLVEPGTLGVNIFYLAGSGVQVYCYKKDFPALAVGDVIQVTGTISSAYGETRIKIKDRNDIKMVATGKPPLPDEVFLDEISDELEGSLIKVIGEVTSIKGDDFWLDDAKGEIRVVVKKTTDIDLKNFDLAVGDRAEVAGILSQTQSGWRLLPRSKNDLTVQKVLGERDTESTENTKNTKSTKALLKYLLVLAGAVIVVLGVLLVRKSKALLSKK